MQAAGLQITVALHILPEGKERLVAVRKERPAQGGKDPQLVIRPFDRGERIAESDDLLAIVERAPTYQNMGDTTGFQRSDVALVTSVLNVRNRRSPSGWSSTRWPRKLKNCITW
jgi:hypothetical protein